MERARRPEMIALAVVLLLVCAAGFTQAEALKLERIPVGNARFDDVLSPGCRCPQETASLSFRLNERERIDVLVVNEEDEVVRTLASGVRRRPGRVELTWDGRDDAGRVVPDGTYRVRVRLLRDPGTVVIPDEVRVES